MSALLILFGFVVIVSGSPIADLSSLNERIYGGEEVLANSYPFSVVLMMSTSQGVGFCGGVLISQTHVLTAASCLVGINLAIVMLGAHNRRYVEEGQVRFTTTQSEFVIHEDFDSNTLAHNVALIQLTNPVDYSDQIQPIRLPSRLFESTKFTDFNATITGWGFDEEDYDFSEVLRYVSLTILPLKICQHFYSIPLVTSANICTDGGFKTGGCKGDEGGPLITTLSDGSELFIGIGSFISDIGCNSGWPTVFTRVTSYLDWIYEKTGLIETDDLLLVN